MGGDRVAAREASDAAARRKTGRHHTESLRPSSHRYHTGPFRRLYVSSRVECSSRGNAKPQVSGSTWGSSQVPPAGFEPATIGLEVRC